MRDQCLFAEEFGEVEIRLQDPRSPAALKPSLKPSDEATYAGCPPATVSTCKP